MKEAWLICFWVMIDVALYAFNPADSLKSPESLLVLPVGHAHIPDNDCYTNPSFIKPLPTKIQPPITNFPLEAISEWDLAGWSTGTSQDHDVIADYVFNDTVPPGVYQNFPFLNKQTQKLQEKANIFFDNLGQAGKLLSSLSELEKVKFPVGMSYTTETGVEIAIGIESLEFTQSLATLHNIFLRVKFAGAPPMIFGALTAKFTRTGGFIQAKLGLIGDVPIPVNGSNETLLILRGYNSRSKTGCEATIGCNGFESLELDASVYISRNLIYPVNRRGEDTGRFVYADVETNISDFRNISTAISLDRSFKIRGVDQAIFTIKKAVFDGSETFTDPMIKFPKAYFGGGESQLNQAQWQGVYIHEIDIALDRFLDLKTEDEFGIEFQNLLIDRFGVTGAVTAHNLLGLDKGNIGVARISIDHTTADVYKSGLQQLEVRGRITVPVLDEGDDQQGIHYAACIENNAWKIAAAISPGDELPFPFLQSALLLKTGTALVIGKAESSEEHIVQVNLCGEVDLSKIWPSNDPDKKNKKSSIYFENFTVQSTSPNIKNIGFWSIPMQLEFPLGPMLFTLDGVLAGLTEKKDPKLYFSGGASFSQDDGFNISGQVGVSIYGKFDAIQNNRLIYDRTEVDRVGLCIAASSWGAKIDLYWFKEDPKYGNGFAGKAAVALKSMGYEQGENCDFNAGIFASAVFGNVDSTRYYNFELLYLNLNQGIPMGPVAIHGIGGAISNGMSASGIESIQFGQIDYSDTKAVNNAQKSANAYASDESIGESVLGIVYAPDPNAGFSLRLMTIMAANGKSNIANMNALLAFNFNSGGGLNNITLDIQGQLFAQMNLDSISKVTVPVYFGAAVLYDNLNRIFSLTAEVFINLEGKIMGGGNLAFYADPDKWYLHIGQPGQPGNIGLLIPAISVETNAYFCAGSYNVPDMPLLPVQIRNLFSGASSNRTFDVSTELAGLAFGAHLDIGDPAEKSFLFFYYKLHVLVGMDVNLRNYKGYSCNGNEDFGIRQWYAKGQVYAYLDGAIGLKAAGKRFPILELAAGFKIYLETPKPTYGEFGIAVKYKVLGGLIKGRAKIEASFGHQCNLAKNSLELNVFDEVITPNDALNLNITQDITFSSGVPFYQPFPDDLGNSLFTVHAQDYNLNTSNNQPKFINVWDEAAQAEIRVPNPDYQPQENVNYQQFGFAYYQENGATQKIKCLKSFSEDNTFVTYTPEHAWPPNTKIWIRPEAHFKQSSGGENWKPVPDGNGQTAQDTIYEFMTGVYPDKLPAFNIEFTYPVNGMSNYYPAQNGGTGIIRLKKGLEALFKNVAVEAKITCHSDPTVSFSAPCNYDAKAKTLSWKMQPAQMENGGIYSIYFSDGHQEIINPIHFRCSEYNLLEDKLNALFDIQDSIPQPKLTTLIMTNQGELFDQLELFGHGDIPPLISFEYNLLDLYNSYGRTNKYTQLKANKDVIIYNRYDATSIYEEIPKIEVSIPDQLGEKPAYSGNIGIIQQLRSYVHSQYALHMTDMLLELEKLDYQQSRDWYYGFMLPKDLRIKWKYHLVDAVNVEVEQSYLVSQKR